MRNTISDDTKESIADGITECTGKTAGSLAGSAIGSVFAGPGGAAVGAIAGAAIEHIFQKAGNGIKKRVLAPSEDKRVGTVYVQAKNIIEQKCAEGSHPRDDGFFDGDEEDRSAGEELLEGVLIAAQREYEEKKTVYLARLYANILFHPEISRPMANHLLKISEQLTYRQIVILGTLGSFVVAGQALPELKVLKQTAYTEVSGLENVAIAAEIYDMYRMSILGSSEAILDSAGINPSALVIVGYGANLYNLMELHNLEQNSELPTIQAQIVEFLIGHEAQREA